ncbi:MULTISPECIES: hypothetical protein [unclassified Bradyrhizobium]|uniref:hypothetical protein n=1 Tax=unclassified Bradyrhizobium TaxID=2631580 RepID=UPI0028EDE63E|nr:MULTISPECIES: hypothetical protein [unclassified Bradyrhizobium]
MSDYFAIESRYPWCDYGDILVNGLIEEAKGIGLPVISRTGPYVPPMTQPFGFIIVTDEFRGELESSRLTGFDFMPTQYGKVVRLDWQTWSTLTDEPMSYPETGEPEDYVLEGPHDPALLAQMPRLWALAVQPTSGLQIQGTRSFRIDRHPGTDIAREFKVHWVTERMKVWLERSSAGQWIAFRPVTPK